MGTSRSAGRLRKAVLETLFKSCYELGGTKESNSVVTPCGLHSRLRQQGFCLFPSVIGTAEAMPLTKHGLFQHPLKPQA